MSSQVTIYGRAGSGFVTPDDQTVAGLWISRGDVEVVALDVPSRLGEVVIEALRRSRTGVPHPSRGEWVDQRRHSLSPVIEAAGVRSWRSFIRVARVATVVSLQRGATVHAWRRDGRRPEVFEPDVKRTIVGVELQPAKVSEALIEVLTSSA